MTYNLSIIGLFYREGIMKKLDLANLPTRIEKLSFEYNDINVYLKRDDQTGFELSGNKVRKLEYSLQEALDLGCDTVITCGGIQSNHARATAIAAVKLGLQVHLVLKENETPAQGNYFINQFIGAKIHLISNETYQDRHNYMKALKDRIDVTNKAYIIPEGASNGIGNFGYLNGFYEIQKQEEALGISFDYIVMAYGSGSTYAGLLMGAKALESKTQIIGYNIYNPNIDAFKMVKTLIDESKVYTEVPDIEEKDVHVSPEYVGLGYAKSCQDELDFIKNFARKEGVMLDTVYTGKAMFGLILDIEQGKYAKGSNVLFIHTGGQFGNFSKTELFDF